MDGPHSISLSHNQKSCIACFQPIDSRARICQECGSSQTPKKWKILGSGLKWAGGITAVISLVITLGQINNYLSDWKSGQRNIAIFLESANIQRDAGDYITAWQSYDNVLAIDPGNTRVFDEQLKLATSWLQNVSNVQQRYSLSTNTRIADYLDTILPVLYRGIVTANNEKALSNIYAHIGLLHLFKFQATRGDNGAAALENISLETLEKALEKDRHNIHANAYMAYARYYFEQDKSQWDLALPHIEVLEKQFGNNKRSDIIYQLLLVNWSPDSYALPKALQLYRENKILIERFHKRIFQNKYYTHIGSGYSKSLTANLRVMSKSDTLELFNYLRNNITSDSIPSSMALLNALLDEAHGNTDSAKSKFINLQQLVTRKEFKGKGRAEINQALKRLDIPDTR